MSILHIVRQSAFSTCDYLQCSQVIQENDTLVLCDDGCYNLSHPLTTLLVTEKKNLFLKVIELHAKARGLHITSSVEPITMATLVELTLQHDKVITWQ